MPGCGLATRAIVVEIIDCGTVDDVLNAANARDRFELRVQLVFAEEATVGVVRAITGIFQFGGLNDFVLKTKPLDDAVDLRALVSRQARRLARDANCAWSELGIGNVSDIAAIDAA